LVENPSSWHKVSNLLFIESPPGVGFSYNLKANYTHTDSSTAQDNMAALQDFFRLYPEYRANAFWLAGESYAGKYIPDLAVLIDKYNMDSPNKINFKGMLVGNGVMNFEHLSRSEVNYMWDRSFVDP
jgi:carboxypeptidase C (cathepsin A)